MLTDLNRDHQVERCLQHWRRYSLVWYLKLRSCFWISIAMHLVVPRCIILFECICSRPLQIWLKNFQMVFSGISLFVRMKCLIIFARSPALANSYRSSRRNEMNERTKQNGSTRTRTMYKSFSSTKCEMYLITFGWSNCFNRRRRRRNKNGFPPKNNGGLPAVRWFHVCNLQWLWHRPFDLTREEREPQVSLIDTALSKNGFLTSTFFNATQRPSKRFRAE